MNTDINYIKANILNYEICFSILGWTVKEIDCEFSLCITEDIAKELIKMMKTANQ
jgi:hypothetical protein